MRFPPLLALLPLAACAGKPPAIVQAPPPPPPVVAPPAMPAGGVPGMVLPARLADGSWPTPSHGVLPGTPLSADGAAWHLRAALNVAALVCRDDALIAGYNTLLAARRTELSNAEKRYAGEWQAAAPADWRDAYDDAMTRLYNFYGQSFARAPFCAAAAETVAQFAQGTSGFDAGSHLAALDRPFTSFFSAYEAWKAGVNPPEIRTESAATAPIFALAGPVPATPQRAKPQLQVDPAVLATP